jgi:hypothetical protein
MNSNDTSNYYTPGAGQPAVSTADYYHLDGLYWMRPYDLMTMGPQGQAIAAQKGRYFWITSPDHAGGTPWSDGTEFMGGFSDDPGVFPTSLHVLRGFTGAYNFPSGVGDFLLFQVPSFVYNPDDPSMPFYAYAEGGTNGTDPPIQFEEGYARSSDLFNWVNSGPSHPNQNFQSWSAYQVVTRAGTGSWYSYGLLIDPGVSSPGFPNGRNWDPLGTGDGKWVSTDGHTFTPVNGPHLVRAIGNTTFQIFPGPVITMGGQNWVATDEDARNPDPAGGEYATLVPVDANLNILSSPAAIRLSSKYDGVFPGPGFLQGVQSYAEDGILHIYAQHGFFNSCLCHGTMTSAPYLQIYLPLSSAAATGDTVLHFSSVPSNVIVGMLPTDGGTGHAIPGITTITAVTPTSITLSAPLTAPLSAGTSIQIYKGGLWQQYYDYYTYVFDPVAAAGAAPTGVKASAAGGVVTLSWMNTQAGSTYRVYRGSSANGPWTSIGDVNGFSTTDSPALGQQWFYKVMTLQGGVEKKSRIVHAFNSNSPILVNAHVDRAITDGADPSTIDTAWLTSVDNWLLQNNLENDLLFWTDSAFGVKKSGNVISKVYDLGTTRLPRGGDYTPNTTKTTYSATGMNGRVPAWVNADDTAVGYFGNGRFNNLRRLLQITTVAAYQKTSYYPNDQKTLLGLGEGGIDLVNTAGTPGQASFDLWDNTHDVSALAPLSNSAAHIIGGVFDGTNLIAYGDGSASAPQGGLNPNLDLSANTILKGLTSATSGQIPFLESGSNGSKAYSSTGQVVFDNGQASFAASDLIVFDKGLTSAQMSSLTNLLRTRIGN